MLNTNGRAKKVRLGPEQDGQEVPVDCNVRSSGILHDLSDPGGMHAVHHLGVPRPSHRQDAQHVPGGAQTKLLKEEVNIEECFLGTSFHS